MVLKKAVPEPKSKNVEIYAQAIVEGATQSNAYRKAYPGSRRWKDETIHKKACEFNKIAKVLGRVEVLRTERLERHKIDADYVLKRLIEIDEMDVSEILNDDQSLKPVRDWPITWRRTISGVDVSTLLSGEVEAVLKKIKWPDKLKNLELIGKHIGVQAFKERLEVKTVNLNVDINESCSMQDAVDVYIRLVNQ